MNEKKLFEIPTIETYDRDELVIESAFTGDARSQMASDRRLKKDLRRASGRRTLAVLLRR